MNLNELINFDKQCGDVISKYEKIFGANYDVLIKIGEKYDQYKSRAKRKGIDFTLSFKKFDEIVKMKCHYCKVPIKNKPQGIDRVDNNRGYTKKNCVPCCWTCNRAKGTMGYNEYKNYLKRFREV